MTDRVSLLFPIEGIDRELDFRLVLAGVCAGPGNRVLLAQHDLLHAHVESMRGGVYLGKNVFATLFPTDLGRYNALRRRGLSFVHLDEEGLVARGGDPARWPEAFARRLDPSCLRPGDRVCAWGGWQRDFYRAKAPAISERIIATGHPRFELCKPRYRGYLDEEVSDLRRRFGTFVLVNTSFGTGNSAFGVEHVFSPSLGYRPERSVRDQHVRRWGHERRLVGHYVALVHRLSLEMPHQNFVVRPHPTEDRHLYEVIFRESRNVQVVREGPVTPWLLACDAMIHERCTTGVEAALAGTPIINYEPIADDRGTMYVPGLFGAKARTEDEAISAVAEALDRGRQELEPDDVGTFGRDLLANFDQDALTSVAKVVADAEVEQHNQANVFCESGLARLVKRQKVIDAVKRPIRPAFPEKARAYAANRGVFYGFAPETIDRKLAAVQRLTGKRLRHRMHSDVALVIESPDPPGIRG